MISAGTAVLSASALVMLGLQAPAMAAAPDPSHPAGARTAPSTNVEPVCGKPKPGEATCLALRRTDIKPVKGLRAAGTPAPSGFGPSDLQSAYGLPADGGAGQTIAIVDAYDDPTAEADLAIYRRQYGLPACTAESGCFRQVDQRGGTDYPKADQDWSGEISLDLDMVSAVAPYAHILLVEADDTDLGNMGAAVDTAVALGAKYVSNSYGSDYRGGAGEGPEETTALDAHFNHPGVAVVAASGDFGYGVGYPAASPYVTSVGGTSLSRDAGSARGWSESVWSNSSGGPGSGCSAYEPKPAFQKDTGCDMRTVSDVSAVSDPYTGVAIYQTYGGAGWSTIGGTSAASPIIAGVYAAAGTPVAGTYPNSYPYAAGTGINDVTTGSNGDCDPAYLCTGTAGYDGPTGLGTPDGLAAFRMGAHGELSGTVTDSVTGTPVSGATVTAGDHITHTDSRGTYSLVLPAGSYDLSVATFGYTTGRVSLSLADGDTLTRNVGLAQVAGGKISGKVTDGSGHGWPLYAKITVDDVPGGPVWTDPATGSYSLSLPQGRDYTLHIATTAPGYRALTRTITVSKASQALNLPVPADSWAETAPGYSLNLTGTTEPFDSTVAAPQGWSVTDADGTTGGWQFDDPGSRGNRTGGDGAFAVVDSDHLGGAAVQDSHLVSPSYDFTHNTSPELAFNTEYQAWDGHTLAVEASDDGGATWKNVWSWTLGEGEVGPARVEVPLTDYAGESAVQVRFHYAAQYGLWWEIDDVFVGERGLTTTPGAMVVGSVTDANTGTGVVGATVASQDDPAVRATTLATPDDPALGDGFYSTFSPDTGRHGFSAAKSRYTTLAKTVKVDADSTVPADFKLKAGQLTVSQGRLSAPVGWGKQTTKKLTVKNSGSAPATVKLGETSGGVQAATAKGAPLQRIKGNFSPLSRKAQARTGKTSATKSAQPAVVAARSPWQIQANFPEAIADNAVDTYGGKVYSAFGYTGGADTSDLYVLDPAVGSWTQLASAQDTRENPSHGIIDGKLVAVGGWDPEGNADAKLEIYDPASDSWTTGASAPDPHVGAGSAVLDGKLYTVGGCEPGNCDGTTDVSVYDALDDSWSHAAPYPEQIAWESCGGIGHKLYCAGGLGGNNDVPHTYVYDPEADTWSQVADMPTPRWGSSYTSANGLLLISCGVSGGVADNQGVAFDPKTGAWSALPNANTATVRGGGSSGFYKVGGETAPAQPTRTVELLPGYSQQEATGTSWLSESTSQFTLQPGASTTVTVTLDSAVPEITQPGDYTARLSLASDTPYPAQRVPVTLHVDPPATWGKITGTVLGATAGGGTTPLAGATVQINSWAAAYSLTTASDGRYSLWLDSRNNPLTVIVTKEGYQPVVATLKVVKGAVVTTGYTLKKQ
jgi:N-acetylneuraminic acid mutarotase